MRNHNCHCAICNKPIYRRPNELRAKPVRYCSQECFQKTHGKLEIKPCLYCSKQFKGEKQSSKYCSVSCSNHARRGMSYDGKRSDNASQRKLKNLQAESGIMHCMVEKCQYQTTLDVHRLVKGSEGGKYEMGNMFALCPNHHAEVTRNIITLTKIEKFVLQASRITHLPKTLSHSSDLVIDNNLTTGDNYES